jgi:hypothetical protein
MAWCLVKHRDKFTFYIYRQIIEHESTGGWNRVKNSIKWRAGVAQLVQWLIMDWTIEVRGIDSEWRLGIFFSTESTPTLGSIQPPIQRVPGALSLGVKRPGRETNHSPPPNAEVKNVRRYTSTRHYVFMAWCLVKHRDDFTLMFTVLKYS